MSSAFPSLRNDDHRSSRAVLDLAYSPYSADSPPGDADENASLRSQALNADGTPKRPMNAFMIFARRRRPEVSAQNQMMRTGEISKILSKEWNTMPITDKQFYLDQAKKLKETFNSRYPDYVYRRRPNNSRKKRRTDAAPYDPALSPHDLSHDLHSLSSHGMSHTLSYDDDFVPNGHPHQHHHQHHHHQHHPRYDTHHPHGPLDAAPYRLPNPVPYGSTPAPSFDFPYPSRNTLPFDPHAPGPASSGPGAPPLPLSNASFSAYNTPAEDTTLWPASSSSSAAGFSGVKIEGWNSGSTTTTAPPTLRLSGLAARRGHPSHPPPLPLHPPHSSRHTHTPHTTSPTSHYPHSSYTSPTAYSHSSHGSHGHAHTSHSHTRNWSDSSASGLTTAATTTTTTGGSLSGGSASCGGSLSPPSSAGSGSFPSSASYDSGMGPGGAAAFGGSDRNSPPGSAHGIGGSESAPHGFGASIGDSGNNNGPFQTLTAPFYPGGSSPGSGSGATAGGGALGLGLGGGLGLGSGGGAASPSTASASSSSSYFSNHGHGHNPQHNHHHHHHGSHPGSHGSHGHHAAATSTSHSHSHHARGGGGEHEHHRNRLELDIDRERYDYREHHQHHQPHQQPRAYTSGLGLTGGPDAGGGLGLGLGAGSGVGVGVGIGGVGVGMGGGMPGGPTLGSTLAPLALSPANVGHGSLWGRGRAEV